VTLLLLFVFLGFFCRIKKKTLLMMKMLIKNQKNQKNQQNLKNHKNPPNLKKKGPLRILRIHKREGYSDSEDFTDSQERGVF